VNQHLNTYNTFSLTPCGSGEVCHTYRKAKEKGVKGVEGVEGEITTSIVLHVPVKAGLPPPAIRLRQALKLLLRAFARRNVRKYSGNKWIPPPSSVLRQGVAPRADVLLSPFAYGPSVNSRNTGNRLGL